MIDKTTHVIIEQRHIINKTMSGKNLIILTVGPVSPESQKVNPDNIKLKLKIQNLIWSAFVLFFMHAVRMAAMLYKIRYRGIQAKNNMVYQPSVSSLRNKNSMLKIIEKQI